MAKEPDIRRETREAMEGCGAALVAIDSAVRKATGYEGPPGTGLHRVLAAAAATLGVRPPSFPPPADPPSEGPEDEPA